MNLWQTEIAQTEHRDLEFPIPLEETARATETSARAPAFWVLDDVQLPIGWLCCTSASAVTSPTPDFWAHGGPDFQRALRHNQDEHRGATDTWYGTWPTVYHSMSLEGSPVEAVATLPCLPWFIGSND